MPRRCASSTSPSREPERGAGAAGAVAAGGQGLLPAPRRAARHADRRPHRRGARASGARGREPARGSGASRDPRGLARASARPHRARRRRRGGACPGRATARGPAVPRAARASALRRRRWLARRSCPWISAGRRTSLPWSRRSGLAVAPGRRSSPTAARLLTEVLAGPVIARAPRDRLARARRARRGGGRRPRAEDRSTWSSKRRASWSSCRFDDEPSDAGGAWASAGRCSPRRSAGPCGRRASSA